MKLSIKAALSGIVFFPCFCLPVLTSEKPLKADVYLEHLNNGLTFCLAYEENCADDLDINMMVKFDQNLFSPREKSLSLLMQKLVNKLLVETFIEKNSSDICLRKPQMYSVPNLVLYGMDLSHPTQKALDETFSLLSDLFNQLLHADIDAIEVKIEKLVSDGCNDGSFIQDEEDGETSISIEKILPLLSASELKNFSDFYYRPENMVLFVRGNLKDLEVAESIKNSFSMFLASNESKPFRFGVSSSSIEKIQLVSSDEQGSQPQLFPGFKIIEDSVCFEDLTIEEKEAKMIERLMHTLATANFAKLIWKQRDLERIGRSINHIHPLKFISHIVSEPILRSDLQEVHRNFFKWKGFMDGFRRRMTEEFYKGNLEKFLPGFCETMGIKEDVVDHFIERRDWEGLVRAILY